MKYTAMLMGACTFATGASVYQGTSSFPLAVAAVGALASIQLAILSRAK